jgi:hypothetical protein
MNGGTNAYSFNQSFAVDSKGNIFAVGVCTDTSYFTTKKGSNIFINGIDSNFYLAKYNANGDFLWAKNMHGNLNRKGNTIAIDEHDNIYIVGYYINLGIKHDYILKLDSNINYVWQKPCNDATLAVSVDAKGNVYCVGNLIYKFDPMGNIIYWKVLTSTAALGNSVSQDKWGNCFITGSINYRDIFISKLDTAGSLQWTKIFIDSLSKFNSQSGNSIKLDNLGNSYTTGTFDGVIDFDPSVNNYTLRSGANSCCPSMFILKLDSAGNFVWAKMFEK